MAGRQVLRLLSGRPGGQLCQRWALARPMLPGPVSILPPRMSFVSVLGHAPASRKVADDCMVLELGIGS